MKRKKEGKLSIDKIYKYTDDDFWDYWHRFMTFRDEYSIYWKSLKPEAAFHQQRSLFIPMAFYKLLCQEKSTLTSISSLRKAVESIVNFASLSRSTFEKNPSSRGPGDNVSSPKKIFLRFQLKFLRSLLPESQAFWRSTSKISPLSEGLVSYCKF
jgi:hypothetical protein